jgi:adenylate cyclase
MEYTSFSYRNGILYGESLLKPSSSLGISGEDFQTGFVNLYTDSDGVTRSFIPKMSGIEEHDHFSKIVVEEYTGVPSDLGNSRMLINFITQPGGYQYIPFTDVYYNKTNLTSFKDKIVLIGATASNLHDDAIVPISNQAMPGVEINANIVQSILTKDFLYYQDDISATVMIFIFALFSGFLLFRLKIQIATIFLILLSVLYILFSIYMFDSGLIINILFPLLSIIIVYIIIVVIYYLTEEKSRKWITSVFGKYVSPVVIENLIKNPEKIKLGGEKKNITIFFSDIRGFTPISEKLEPEKLVYLLNEYLTEMTSIIIKEEGLVDKYMGDAIMAFWGAPLDQPNHAEMACSSSLKMISKLKALQQEWKEDGIPIFDIGIGLNSGDAIVGNMGSKSRFDYTAMGDNVNLASRIENLNKYYGTNILITEKTANLIKNKFETRKLDKVRVKGKKKPIAIYELLSIKNKLDKKQYDFLSLYQNGLTLYFNKKWDIAIKEFQSAKKIINDKASQIFIMRCQEFIKNPPSKEWDGVWEMNIK